MILKIQSIEIQPYALLLKSGHKREGAWIKITDSFGNFGMGEIAPLPNWSNETLSECLEQFKKKEVEIRSIDWEKETIFQELDRLNLLPSLSFGLEAALFSILDPLADFSVPVSCLLTGTFQEILSLSTIYRDQGYRSAKLKVSQLDFNEAFEIIHQLKEHFQLRIDVNRSWITEDSLRFFSQFSLDAFDYVEEPFQNPNDLFYFEHPLAVDESFPTDLTLGQLEKLPSLKAIIYKPTIQGGMLKGVPLYNWAKSCGVSFILSSSFESDLGLAQIASFAHRLSIKEPVGIGTYDYLKEHFFKEKIRLINSTLLINNNFQ